MKTVNGYEVIQWFEQFSPKKYAVEGDKIGLQIGTLNKAIKKVMVTLDVLEHVVDEAIDNKIDLIIAHHPPIFKALATVTDSSPAGKIVTKCIKNDIAVYVAHTNLDVTNEGVNDLLADALKLNDTEVLVPTYEEGLRKLSVFVPESHEDEVRNALGNAGAGHIGHYSHCTFTIKGAGRFLPLEGTDPFIGEKGQLEKVAEVKVETIYPVSLEKKVLNALIKTHPYEEIAYDIFMLQNEGEKLGLGRVGKLAKSMTLAEFAEYTKVCLDVRNVRVVGDVNSSIKKVAVLGGDGNKYIHAAKYSGADVYVTGDLYFHTAHDAMALGLNVVDPGHYAEKIMKQGVADKLQATAERKKWQLDVIVSKTNTDPFTFM
ncbi:Nif3-like dinuclear metal center hexameric protein [Sutcliffiella rhizosphaerae]|uniref:GTP cyclohydrolase 1 type 2 homolog n=1 Tax=Sutcliffiella rhizosphaerae TaxID=2880967 RepID=A0ABM8YHG3_9BACI|nr:Nif3-like dinuclear metal center hexameric protein [Sutcliffiella rhizosphaerae]CAG9619337.1 GTP cyclohydrolase 1 type 2 [Sutcliffiella rhizosphaerae]